MKQFLSQGLLLFLHFPFRKNRQTWRSRWSLHTFPCWPTAPHCKEPPLWPEPAKAPPNRAAQPSEHASAPPRSSLAAFSPAQVQRPEQLSGLGSHPRVNRGAVIPRMFSRQLTSRIMGSTLLPWSQKDYPRLLQPLAHPSPPFSPCLWSDRS